MGWNAKPKGAYSYTSDEGEENLLLMASFFSSRGYTEEAQAGIVGNSMAESGLNPWRWQNDSYRTNMGYGLFQYTPATGYLNGAKGNDYYAPNLSTTKQTEGAEPTDAICQMDAFDTNLLGKWVSSCWRTYWDKTKYATLYSERSRILETYGSNSKLSLSQFRTIDNVWDATFAFLACFEGPSVPNIDARYSNASNAYQIITGTEPPDPTPTPTPTPSPTPDYKSGLPFWMLLRRF